MQDRLLAAIFLRAVDMPRLRFRLQTLIVTIAIWCAVIAIYPQPRLLPIKAIGLTESDQRWIRIEKITIYLLSTTVCTAIGVGFFIFWRWVFRVARRADESR